MSQDQISRRTFLQGALAIPALAWLGGRALAAPAPGSASVVAVAGGAGRTAEDLVDRAVAQLGGWSQFIKPGFKVVIKPNLAWRRTPGQAANTHPDVLAAVIKACRKAGAASVQIVENPVHRSQTFALSGAQALAKQAGVPLRRTGSYRTVAIPRGRKLKSVNVDPVFLEADLVINLPVAKVHGVTRASFSLKNQMGMIENRAEFHTKGIHDCIADLATVLKPGLNILDATHVLKSNGPVGPGNVTRANQVAASTDMVALDAWACALVGLTPAGVRHIQRAASLGVGQADPGRVALRKDMG